MLEELSVCSSTFIPEDSTIVERAIHETGDQAAQQQQKIGMVCGNFNAEITS